MPPDNNNRAGVEDLGGPQQWYESLPIVTKFWFTGALVLTCAGNFGLFGIPKLIFMWEPLKNNFEIWRLVTPFCYVGGFDISTLFGLYMLVTFSRMYEDGGPYNTGGGGGTADYVFCLLFGCVTMLVSYPFLMSIIPPIFAKNLTYYVLYVWSKQNPDAPANIWGFPVKAIWLPFAYLAITVLMGAPYWPLIHGIALGHLYYFLVDVVPLVYGKDLLHTPQFLIDYFGVGAYVPPVPTAGMDRGQGGNVWQAPGTGRVNPPQDPARRPQGGGGHNWGGGGRALGTS